MTGLGEGLRIHRWFPVEQWKSQLEAIKDQEIREGARAYLKDVYVRMQNAKRAKRFLEQQKLRPGRRGYRREAL